MIMLKCKYTKIFLLSLYTLYLSIIMNEKSFYLSVKYCIYKYKYIQIHRTAETLIKLKNIVKVNNQIDIII